MAVGNLNRTVHRGPLQLIELHLTVLLDRLSDLSLTCLLVPLGGQHGVQHSRRRRLWDLPAASLERTLREILVAVDGRPSGLRRTHLVDVTGSDSSNLRHLDRLSTARCQSCRQLRIGLRDRVKSSSSSGLHLLLRERGSVVVAHLTRLTMLQRLSLSDLLRLRVLLQELLSFTLMLVELSLKVGLLLLEGNLHRLWVRQALHRRRELRWDGSSKVDRSWFLFRLSEKGSNSVNHREGRHHQVEVFLFDQRGSGFDESDEERHRV